VGGQEEEKECDVYMHACIAGVGIVGREVCTKRTDTDTDTGTGTDTDTDTDTDTVTDTESM